MIRFETHLRVVGTDQLLRLKFHSTIVAPYFSLGESFTGLKLRETLRHALGLYRDRLEYRQSARFAAEECQRIERELGADFKYIKEAEIYEVSYSQENLCSCEIPCTYAWRK